MQWRPLFATGLAISLLGTVVGLGSDVRGVSAAGAPAAAAKRLLVKDVPGFYAALKAARGGETIALAPGTYANLAFKVGPVFEQPVTIVSADPSRRAILTDFTMSKAKGLTFKQVEFAATDHPELASAGSYWAFKVLSSTNIHFDDVHVHGSLDHDASNDVQGLQFRNSRNVSVINSEFQELERALLVHVTYEVVASGNYVHDLRSDGFDLAEVGDVKLIGNVFRNFRAVGSDHPDAIQFWTTRTKTPSHDILISDNVVLRGDGGFTQGIFVTDQTGTMPYERLTITNNLIVGTGYNALRVGGAKDLTIKDNKLVTFSDGMKTFMLIRRGVGVQATGNSAVVMSFEQSTNVNESGNKRSSPVSDSGVAIIKKWIAENPLTATRLRLLGH